MSISDLVQIVSWLLYNEIAVYYNITSILKVSWQKQK